MVPFEKLPPTACWQHQGLRLGFEVAYFALERGSVQVDGTTTGFQDGETWVVDYRLHLNEELSTRSAQIVSTTLAGTTERWLESDGAGHWVVDGEAASHLDGCLDVDLESSAMTNAFPVHRLALGVGDGAPAPAAYVRVPDSRVELLSQRYRRVDDDPRGRQYEYEAPSFDFHCRLLYDRSGLALEYPGIAVRAA